MRLQNPSGSGLAIGEADNRYLRLAGGTMTGELNALAGLNTTRPYSSGLVPAGLSDPAPAFPFQTEWNNAGKNWTAFQVNATNTASGSSSKLARFSVGGADVCAVSKDGSIQVANVGVRVYSSSDLTGQVKAVMGTGSEGKGILSVGNDGALGFSSITNGDGVMDSAIQRDSAGVVRFTNGFQDLRDWKARRGSLSEYLDITEMSAPAAPAANTARLYVEDDGSGKTRLMVLFPTGAAQVLATEP